MNVAWVGSEEELDAALAARSPGTCRSLDHALQPGVVGRSIHRRNSMRWWIAQESGDTPITSSTSPQARYSDLARDRGLSIGFDPAHFAYIDSLPELCIG